MINYVKSQELRQNLLAERKIHKLFTVNKGVSYVHHKINPLLIGSKFLLKVVLDVGISTPIQLGDELKKIETIMALPYSPDLLFDHTSIVLDKPMWRHLVENTDVPIGVVPVFSAFDDKKGIDKNRLLETIVEMASGGVSLMSLHPTATNKFYSLAKTTRKIPVTSRGGSLLIKDNELNGRETNVIAENFTGILKLFKKYNVTLSLGSVFRPARIDEALDEVHLAETKEHKQYIEIAKANGVNVIMQGIGHISLTSISRYCDLIKDYDTPIMPLGPTPTDYCTGFDHVPAAIGATILAMQCNVGLINSVTRVEHMIGIPTIENSIEGLMCAKAVAHMINLERFNLYKNMDKTISDNRAIGKTCIVSGGLLNVAIKSESNMGCIRCDAQCPLTVLG